MRILLLGEYSNVHATLARGLKALGHDVTVASNGDFWKDYPRDIDLQRRPGFIGTLRFMLRLLTVLPRLRGYDVVQLVNPMFLELKAERLFPIYRYLRRHNKRVVLGAFGMDYYWVHTCSTQMPLRYSDFNIGTQLRTNDEAIREQRDWTDTPKARLNQLIARDCDGIVSCLYEYHVCYHPVFPEKTQFIPLPIQLPEQPKRIFEQPKRLRLFIGISKNRSAYKGTDIMLRAAQAIASKYPEKVELQVAEGVPFSQYEAMMNQADAILDQLYSYTPSMNSLLAMSKGIICIGGGEPENYEILHEDELRPIVNVEPNYESVCQALERLVLHPEIVPELQSQSRLYIMRHHDYLKVASQYETFYRSLNG